MKIAVNTRFLIANKLEGIGRFTYETLYRIVTQHPEIEFHFIFDRKFDDSFIFSKNIVPHVIYPQARHPWLWYWWFDWSLPSVLNKIKPDIFLSTDGYLSLKSDIKTHLTIHDISFEHFENAVPPLVQKYYKKNVPLFAQKAYRICTVSQFSKMDIVEKYSIDANKIDVVYNGASNYFAPILSREKLQIQNEIANACPYFITVSSLHFRKNIIRLIQAFDQFKVATRLPHKLILVGDFMFGNTDFFNVYNNLSSKEDIRLMGVQTHETIAKWVAAADVVLYVSLFEGFGIPIIEAMQSGVPVITSNCSSMPEIAGDAAITVDPYKLEEIANAITTLVSNPKMQEELIFKGFQQCKKFAWQITADLYWQSVEKALST